MNLLRDRLKQALEESGISKTALAKAVGVGASSVSQWLSGETKSISSEHIFLAARALGVNPEWLATGRGPMRPVGQGVKKLDTFGWVPILSWHMAQNPDVSTGEGPAEKAAYVAGGERTYALKIEGDAMDGRDVSFRAGEIIHVDPDDTDVDAGKFVIAKLTTSNQVVFRQLQYDADTPYLRALHPQWPPIREPFEILGRVVGRSQVL